MKDSREKVIQHFVPQCYLRKFGINKKMIFKFSKKDNSYEEAQIKDCCQIDDYYTLLDCPNPLYIEVDILDYREENVFGPILNQLWKISRDVLLNRIDNFNISSKEQEIIARCIAVQFLRGPSYRHAAIQKEKKSDYAKISMYCNMIGFDIEEISFQYNEANIHGDIIASNTIISEHQNYILNKKWEFLFTSDYFFTSDEPVIIIPINNIPVLPHEYLKYNHTVYFPLNSHLLVKISPFLSEENKNNSHVSLRELETEELGAINELIINNSKEYYFGAINDGTQYGKTTNEKP